MTDGEAVKLLFDYDLALYNARMGEDKRIFLRGAPQIIAVIEQQASTINKMKCCANCDKWWQRDDMCRGTNKQAKGSWVCEEWQIKAGD